MISKDRDVEFHRKGWGYEKWMANSALYCGKLLVVESGLRCSIHYHKLKDETFYIQDGIIIMRVWEDTTTGWPKEGDIVIREDFPNRDNGSEFLMEKGDRIVLPPNTPHQFIGVDAQSTIIEISTQHFEDDSYRILKGD
jgi:D-lyxose ketol-isomerase